MRTLIPGIPLSTHRHYDCVYVLLDSLLRFLGHDPEALLFDNWEFIYCRAPADTFLLAGRSRSIGAALAERGLAWTLEKSDDLERAWAELRRLIHGGRPVGVGVDVYELARAGLFPRRHHAPHALIVSGCDDERHTVHLVDPSPWQVLDRDIPLALFERCWDAGRMLGGGGRYQWSYVESEAAAPEPTPEGLFARLEENLDAMEGGDAGEVCWGLKGIARFAADLGDWVEAGERDLQRRCGRCFGMVQEIALLREGHGRFIAQLAARCGSRELKEVSRRFGRLSQSWFVARNIFLKGSRKEAAPLVPRLRARLGDIEAEERSLWETLREHPLPL